MYNINKRKLKKDKMFNEEELNGKDLDNLTNELQ